MNPGFVVGGRFQIGERGGAGGMGEIYKALDQRTGQPAAIKVLTGQREDGAGRFALEAQILSELTHPTIVRYLADGTLPSGEPFLAMEWLEGEDLSARLARGRLSVAESVALALFVAEALGFAHARGVVHRDLKPGNIFLVGGRVEGVKLLDFGIAQLSAATRVTRTGMMVGTPGYMAPEQARGVERSDARADVFSLGCVLYECLTGEPAFAGRHFMAVLARILFDEPPRARDKRPEVPAMLDGLVARMLGKRVEERPRDGEEVAEVLRSLGEIPSVRATAPAEATAATLEQPRLSGLTGSEQRAVVVILIGAPQPKEGATLDVSTNAALVEEASRHGGHLERLFDGSMAVMLSSANVATDLAAQAARCALALRAHAPERAIALALSRSATTTRSPAGPAIDLAARLVGSPSSAGIVLHEVVAGLLDARFDVREVAAGFVLHGERELAQGTRTLLGKATPCVGRDRELQMLEQLFDACVEEGEARAVLVTAPAGGGKSRLGQELWRHVNASSTKVERWYGAGDPLRADSAFGLLGQCLRRACGILDGEPLEVRRQKLVARVGERLAEDARGRVAEFVGEIIGTPFPDDESLPLRAARKDAPLMHDQMRAAFLDFLKAECAVGPVVIGFEDLHWGDRPTVQFVDYALKALREQPLFVIALARPEVHEHFPKLWSERGLQEIRLKQLNRKAIERLARHVLGEGADRDTIERLERLSEGNAFYLEELIRRAAEGRGTDLPETVVAMVQSRLGALNVESRRILRAASVFGQVFWAGGVATLLGGEVGAASRDRLGELIEREIVLKRDESRLPGEEEYAFRHALLREGAYTMLTDEDRALGHRLAGEWLEPRGEQDMLMLAEHFELGGDGARAGSCYLRAADQALSGGDAAATMAHVRRGLALGVPEPLRIMLLGMLCEAVVWYPELMTAVLPDAEELVRVAEHGSTPWVQGTCVKLNGAMYAGRLQEFMETLEVLLAIDPTEDTAGPLAFAMATGSHLLYLGGRMGEGSRVSARLATIAAATADRTPLASILSHILGSGAGNCTDKDLWRAREHANAIVALAEAVGHGRFLGIGYIMVAMNLWCLGACSEVEHVLKKIALPDEEISYGSYIRPFCFAWLLADRGAFDEARVWASRLVASGQARRLPFEEGPGRWVLAEVLRRAGDLDAAEVEIQAALVILPIISPLDHPGALATLAALRLAQGRPAEALAVAADGMAKAEAMGACSFFFRDAFLHLTHAECLEATGDHAVARAAISKARAWVLSVADKIGDPAYRTSFLWNVPENRRTLDLARQWLGETA